MLTASYLIHQAYYLSGIVARELETVSGAQQEDGLKCLNDLLAERSASGHFIPSFRHYRLPAIAEQQRYDIPDLIVLESLTFTLDQVRFPMKSLDRRTFWGSANHDTLVALPFYYVTERTPQGTALFLKNKPVPGIDHYTLSGQWGFSPVSGDTDLSSQFDRAYLSYLQYALAERLCDFYDLSFSSSKQKRLEQLQQLCQDINPMDLTAEFITCFPASTTALHGADACLGRGWRP